MRRGETCHFLVRRNPNYSRRRQLLATLNGLTSSSTNNTNSNKSFDANSTVSSLEDDSSLLDISIESLTDDIHSLMASDEDEDGASSTSGSSDTSSEGSTGMRRTPSTLSVVPLQPQLKSKAAASDVCPKCRNTFKSCEFCHKNSSMILQLQRSNSTSSGSSCSTTKTLQMHLPSYSPVYNIREIRTATHSFSALGNDKKLLDIQLNGRFDTSACTRLRPQSVCVTRSTRMLTEGNGNSNAVESATSAQSTNDLNGNNVVAAASSMSAAASTVGGEMVNNHPAKGVGHFVYL
uniref:Uncharacterized protein n=1 Tax=Zeugodacus cucurbitae TaxID=28588 RepID=A0A0A1WWD2_ZEUCU